MLFKILKCTNERINNSSRNKSENFNKLQSYYTVWQFDLLIRVYTSETTDKYL